MCIDEWSNFIDYFLLFKFISRCWLVMNIQISLFRFIKFILYNSHICVRSCYVIHNFCANFATIHLFLYIYIYILISFWWMDSNAVFPVTQHFYQAYFVGCIWWAVHVRSLLSSSYTASPSLFVRSRLMYLTSCG